MYVAVTTSGSCRKGTVTHMSNLAGRNRPIRPGILTDKDLGSLDPVDTLTFLGLILYADREGRFPWDPLRFKGLFHPYRDVDIDASMRRLEEKGIIASYEATPLDRKGRSLPEGGKWPKKKYGCIPSWPIHQAPKGFESPSVIPPHPDFPNHTSHFMYTNERKGKERKGKEKKGNEKTSKEKNTKKKKPTESSKPSKIAFELSQFLLEAIRSHKPDFLPKGSRNGNADPVLAKWAKDMDLCIRLDRRDPNDIRRAINYAHRRPSEPFWRAFILSAGKLRQKMETLLIQQQGASDEVGDFESYLRGFEEPSGDGDHREVIDVDWTNNQRK